MASRLIVWFADHLGTTRPDSEVHFHSGPHSHPAVCFDRGCEVPRLQA